jgi:hypothetical protein
LLFLVSIALSGVLRVRLLSSLFGIHRSPFVLQSFGLGRPPDHCRVTQSVLVNQVCFAQQQVSFRRRNRPNWTGLTIGFESGRANPAFQVEMRGPCCIGSRVSRMSSSNTKSLFTTEDTERTEKTNQFIAGCFWAL